MKNRRRLIADNLILRKMWLWTPSSPCRCRLFLFILFILVGVLLYANTLDNGFHYDDDEYVLRNERIRHLPQILDLWITLPSADNVPKLRAHYRPLVFTTYMLNYSVGGLAPAGYHVVNILIHILVAFLVALVMERLTGRLLVGVLSGLLFLVHPFNAEAVNYVTARSSQLYTLFYLLAFYAYLRYRPPLRQGVGESTGEPLREGPVVSPYLWLGLSLLCFALAMLSKEMAVTLPVTLFLYEWLIGPAKGWRDRLRGLGLPGAVALAVVVSYLIIRKVLVGGALQAGMGHDLVRRLSTQGVVLVRTIGLILWPAGLTIDHKVESYDSFAAWPVVGACLVLAGLIVFVLWWGRSTVFNRRLCVFLLVWFFVALSPLMVLRLNSILQENRAYLAIMGVTGLVAMGLVRLLDWARMRASALWWGVWTGVVVSVLVYAGVTIQRNRVWQDDVTLWSDAVQKEPYSFLSRNNLGVAYEGIGLLDQAAEQYRYFWTINPTDPLVLYNLGVIMEKQGRLKEASVWYKAAFLRNPGFYSSLLKLGKQYAQDGHWDDAIQIDRRAMLLWPDGTEAHRLLADALFQAGRREEAAVEYESVLNKEPDNQALRAYVQARLNKSRDDAKWKRQK